MQLFGSFVAIVGLRVRHPLESRKEGETVSAECYASHVSVADVDPSGALSQEWRDHYAGLAAAWVRAHGTLPPSLERLAEWAEEDAGVDIEAELAYLEGRGPDPCSELP